MTRRLCAEFLGTLVLVMSGVGTGILGMQISGGDAGLTLFASAFATGLTLYLLITILGPVSGAHMNPAVTLALVLTRASEARAALPYVAAQVTGGLVAVFLTHAMFDLQILQTAQTARATPALWLSEAVATFGLILVILGGTAHAPAQVPALVGAWIAAAFWFTGSSSYANPAVTLARTLTDTFTGILPAHAAGYIAAQIVAAAFAALVLPKLFSK